LRTSNGRWGNERTGSGGTKRTSAGRRTRAGPRGDPRADRPRDRRQDQVVEELLTCLFTSGHWPADRRPGPRQDPARQARWAQALRLSFNRVQFTPDLMPSDITWHRRARGGRRAAPLLPLPARPVFTNVLPATRSTARRRRPRPRCSRRCRSTRSAPAVRTYALERPFFVLATQNPIEQEGRIPSRRRSSIASCQRLPRTTRASRGGRHRRATTAPRPPRRRRCWTRRDPGVQELVRALPAAAPVIEYAVRLAQSSRPAGRRPEVRARLRLLGRRAPRIAVPGARRQGARSPRRPTPPRQDVRAAGPGGAAAPDPDETSPEAEGVSARESSAGCWRRSRRMDASVTLPHAPGPPGR